MPLCPRCSGGLRQDGYLCTGVPGWPRHHSKPYPQDNSQAWTCLCPCLQEAGLETPYSAVQYKLCSAQESSDWSTHWRGRSSSWVSCSIIPAEPLAWALPSSQGFPHRLSTRQLHATPLPGASSDPGVRDLASRSPTPRDVTGKLEVSEAHHPRHLGLGQHLGIHCMLEQTGLPTPASFSSETQGPGVCPAKTDRQEPGLPDAAEDGLEGRPWPGLPWEGHP